MVVKSFRELNDYEKDKVLLFIDRKDCNTSFSEMEKMFNNKIYDYGNGVIIVFNNNSVVGIGRCVLQEIPLHGIAYIHFLDVLDEVDYKKDIIRELINKLYNKCEEYGATKILLGFRKKETLELLNELNFDVDYEAKIMYLKDRKKRNKILHIENLNEENKSEYMRLYNNAFNNMPHGASLDENELNEFLNDNYQRNYYFIVSSEDENLGVLNVTIDGNEGTFDIGLSNEYRGIGYGKQLLETAIDFLEKKNIEKIYLVVIGINEIAYKMYKKRGFEEERVLSFWSILKE